MIGTIVSIAGTLLSAYSQASAYSEQKTTTKYNKAILDANNRIDNALIDMDIRRIREEGEELIGSQVAYMGASGTKFSGSNIDVFMKTVRDIELDVTTLELEKMSKGAGSRQKKDLLSRRLSMSRKALPLNIGSTLLGGTSSVLNQQSGNIAEKLAKD